MEDEKRKLQRTQSGELDQIKRDFQRKKLTLKDQQDEEVCAIVYWNWRNLSWYMFVEIFNHIY